MGQGIEGVLDYTYNVRGWLKSINKDFANGITNTGKSFGMELSYDWGFATNQYNGNIAGTKWRSKGDKVQRSYGFGYDKVNRLLYADFAQGATYADDAVVNYDMNMGIFTGNVYAEGSAYDENGNIKAMLQYGLKINTSPIIDNLTYTYNANSNKLQNVIEATGVNDPLTKLGDFRISQTYLTALGNPAVKPATAMDYDYDLNGNLKQDLNKDIDISTGVTQGIQYNYLNLPWKINVKNKGVITYLYDAAGNKLEKVTVDNTTPPAGTSSGNKTTSYVAGFVYENNLLQFFEHEEGRVRIIPSTTGGASTFAFDYFIKDHLGNTRAVLTDEAIQDNYPAATLEAASLNQEKNYYSLPDAARVLKAGVAGYPNDTYTTPNDYVQQLSGSATGTKVGSSIVLKVMAGDKFNVRVSSWYKTITGTNPAAPANPLADLVAALTTGVVTAAAGGGHVFTAPDLQAGNVLTPGVTNFLNDATKISPVATRPKAYLNWVLVDEQFNYVASSSGAEQVPDESVYGNMGSTPAVYQHIKSNLPIDKNGYLYIYVSNETPNINVFFDNLQITQVRGPLLEETHYYPFGLTMAGISSKAAGKLENKKKYNGIEFNNDLDLNLYEAFYRDLDPQTGRFLQIDPKVDGQESESPYSSMANDPILKSDPLGDEAEEGNGPGDPPGFFSRMGTAISESVKEVIVLGVGIANAWGSDQVLGAGSKSAEDLGFSGDRGAFFKAGKTIGHGVALGTGLAEIVLGGGGEIASLGIATPLAIPLGLHGVSVMATATSKLLSTPFQKDAPAKPSSPGKMQREVEKGQAPKDVHRVDNAHNPNQGGKPHAHYKDGTASNNDGTTHDAKNGTPNPVQKVIDWLLKHNWVPPNK